MSPDRKERALSEVTREARTESLPDIDWAAIEEQLPMARVHTLPPRPTRFRPLLLAASFALGAAAVALFAWRTVDPAPVASASRASGAAIDGVATNEQDLDGDKLLPGTHVTAGDRERHVNHAGHARWTLAPHSEATLLANGEIITVRLDKGRVVSRVTKSSKTETFAVEAANVRVAAHGTEFVVMLGLDGVSVSVTEGSVLVGPREEPGTGQLLLSPASKRYTLKGLPLEDDSGLELLGGRRPRTTRVDEPPADPTKSGSDASAHVASASAAGRKAPARATEAQDLENAPEDQAPDRLAPEALESATTSVLNLTQACFKSRTIAGEGVRVTAQTSVTFRTLPQGGVSRVVFEPPLSPSVQACVSAGMSAIQTEATRHGFQVSRRVDLER